MRDEKESVESVRKEAFASADPDRGQKRVFASGHSRRKACRFCTDQEYVLDYKNVRVVQAFLTEHGKIVPRRLSGNCAFHQRRLTSAIKKSRSIALVGFSSLG